jgi:uncharacterized protein (TIGR02246 family)
LGPQQKGRIVSIRRHLTLALSCLLLCSATRQSWAQPPQGSAQDKAAIAKCAEEFVEAFHRGDAKALAAHWTPDGDYILQTGKEIKGRAAIEKAFHSLFAENPGVKLLIESASLRFITPDVAVEDGTTSVFAPGGGPPSRARYAIVHAKKDGRWYLSSVRDSAYSPPGNYEHLRGLEGAIGDWAQEGDKGEIERLSVSWAEGQNFLVAQFSTTIGAAAVGSATYWIGWDPVGTRLRSWVFDATGAFGEGSLTQDGKKWVIKTSSILQDGKKASATHVIGLADPETITLQARNRTVDGMAIPDTKEIRLKRTKTNGN